MIKRKKRGLLSVKRMILVTKDIKLSITLYLILTFLMLLGDFLVVNISSNNYNHKLFYNNTICSP